jgi:DNA-binding transcriptional LysR family regulator
VSAGSFSKAAAQPFVSQQPLSEHIKKLATEAGAPLPYPLLTRRPIWRPFAALKKQHPNYEVQIAKRLVTDNIANVVDGADLYFCFLLLHPEPEHHILWDKACFVLAVRQPLLPESTYGSHNGHPGNPERIEAAVAPVVPIPHSPPESPDNP